MEEHYISPNYLSFSFDKDSITFSLEINGTKYTTNFNNTEQDSHDDIYQVLYSVVKGANKKFTITKQQQYKLLLAIHISSDGDEFDDVKFVLNPENTLPMLFSRIEELHTRLMAVENMSAEGQPHNLPKQKQQPESKEGQPH